MARIERADFERTLSQAFHGGECLRRELRLTREEADYLRKTYPRAQILPMPGPNAEKAWYEVRMA